MNEATQASAIDTSTTTEQPGGPAAELDPALASQGADPGESTTTTQPGTEGDPAATEDGDPAAPAAAAAAEEPGDKPQPAADPVNKRFSEITKQRDRAEREAREANERLNRALAALERATGPAPAGTVTEPVAEEQELQPPEFVDPDQYQRDMAIYTQKMVDRTVKLQLKTADVERAKAVEEQKQRERVIAHNQAWQQRRAAAIEELPDYVEVTENENLRITPTMGIAITTADNGPRLAYHLGQHPEVAERIAKLPDALQLMELGKLDAQLAAAAKPKPSKAPPPPAPVRGTGAPQAKSLDEMSMEEYAAARRSGTNH